MTYFLLPQLNANLKIDNLELLKGDSDNIISKSLFIYLNAMKTEITNYALYWDIFKKYTNPYEYIHTTIPHSKISVCKLNPISRSFYKFIEIYNVLNLEFNKDAIKTFHLAEGPGGFIEAIILLRSNNNDTYHGMTLIDNDDNVPGWKKSKYFLSKHENVIIEKGIDNTGNLLSVDNLWHCHNKYKNSMELITGDGGFDFSIDFNKQEVLSHKLIFCQICYAIALQKPGGTFVLKMFDIFSQASIDLLYLLSLTYGKVFLLKPHTSRFANSERFVICKNFKLNDTNNLLEKLATFFPIINSKEKINRFLNINIPYIYISKLEDINAIIGQQQLENILATLYLIDNNKPEKIESLRKINIQKCIQWCIKYELSYNKNIQQINVFLQN
jgi:cap1 methyltransferase